MKDSEFGAAGRRALNQVWNGAGEYGLSLIHI